MKYPVRIKIRPIIEKKNFSGFLKIIGAQNQLLITFLSDLVCNQTIKYRISIPTHTQRISTLLAIKSEQKVIQ